MDINLDPNIVLAHLNQLGFYNISAEQLRDFIRDLKKLIKHDLQKVKHGETEKENIPATNGEETSNTYVGHTNKLFSRVNFERGGNESLNSDFYDDFRAISRSSCEFSRGEDKDGSNANIAQSHCSCCSLSSKKTCATGPSETTSKKTKQNEKISGSEGIKSSFIRPWRLQPSVAPQRCDPVSLYHKYQTIWKQNKIPGEDNRSGLRWKIREKMLGHDPHPRTDTNPGIGNFNETKDAHCYHNTASSEHQQYIHLPIKSCTIIAEFL